MLKNYNCVTVANTPQELVEVPAGNELAIINISASGGSSGGALVLTVNDGSYDAWATKLAIEADDTVFIDSKIFLTTGYKLTAKADASGMSVMVSASLVEI